MSEFLMDLYAAITFPFATEKSHVWWWRIHRAKGWPWADVHADLIDGCPYEEALSDE
jgi:hypothetical protein